MGFLGFFSPRKCQSQKKNSVCAQGRLGVGTALPQVESSQKNLCGSPKGRISSVTQIPIPWCVLGPELFPPSLVVNNFSFLAADTECSSSPLCTAGLVPVLQGGFRWYNLHISIKQNELNSEKCPVQLPSHRNDWEELCALSQ